MKILSHRQHLIVSVWLLLAAGHLWLEVSGKCGRPIITKYLYHTDYMFTESEDLVDENTTLSYQCDGSGNPNDPNLFATYVLRCDQNVWRGVWPRCGPLRSPQPSVKSIEIIDLDETSGNWSKVVYSEGETPSSERWAYRRRSSTGFSPIIGPQKWAVKLSEPVDLRLFQLVLGWKNKAGTVNYLSEEHEHLPEGLLFNAHDTASISVTAGRQYNCTAYYVNGKDDKRSYGLQVLCDVRAKYQGGPTSRPHVGSNEIGIWFKGSKYQKNPELRQITISTVDGCDPPVIPHSMRLLDTDNSGPGYVGERREVVCDFGYTIKAGDDDDENLENAIDYHLTTCGSDLKWSLNKKLSCVPSDHCSIIEPPKRHHLFNHTDPLVMQKKNFYFQDGNMMAMNGSSYEFFCRGQGVRYNLTGPASIKCIDGNWSTTEWPRCLRIFVEVEDYFAFGSGSSGYSYIIYGLLMLIILILSAIIFSFVHVRRAARMNASKGKFSAPRDRMGSKVLDYKDLYSDGMETGMEAERYLNGKYLPRGGAPLPDFGCSAYDDTADDSVYQDVEEAYEAPYEYTEIMGPDKNNNANDDNDSRSSYLKGKKASRRTSSTRMDKVDMKIEAIGDRDSGGYMAPIVPAHRTQGPKSISNRPRRYPSSSECYITNKDLQTKHYMDPKTYDDCDNPLIDENGYGNIQENHRKGNVVSQREAHLNGNGYEVNGMNDPRDRSCATASHPTPSPVPSPRAGPRHLYGHGGGESPPPNYYEVQDHRVAFK